LVLSKKTIISTVSLWFQELPGGIILAQEDKQQKKRLKEAQKTYNKFFKAFKQGKITKDELKEKLRPYKYELKELGYPVKIKDDDRPKEEKEEEQIKETKETKIAISYKPWSKRSSLTIEEIERKVDLLSMGSTSDNLKRLYQSKYGEELPPPEDLIPFERGGLTLPSRKVKGALPAAGDDAEEEGSQMVAGEKRSFWKSLVKGRKEADQEQDS
jgi:hypothetical protein